MVASNFIKYAKLLLTERHDSAAAIRYLEQNQSDLDKYSICYLASLYTKTRQPRGAVTLLKPLLAEGRLLARDAVAHNTHAKALDNAGESAAAAAHLKPLLAEGRLLARDAIAHATYAKALDNAGESAAAVAHLKPLLGEDGLLARNPVAITTIAIALLNAERPDEVLSAVALIPDIDRRNDALLTYVEAKAHFALGHVGQTIMLMTPVVRSFPDYAFAALYLACLDPADQRIPVLKTAFGPRFSSVWNTSRTLQTSLRALAIEERSLFRENRIWQLGARPVDAAALRELGVFTPVRQASRYHR